MCGIVAYYSTSKNAKRVLIQSLKTLHHRGPDSSGYNIFENYGLGHTRLSIIDPCATSNQPFQSGDERFSIIYNGEIYNYLELKSELEEKHFTFKSKSDTEVILNGFIHFREKIVEKLNGMFSFIIYDKKEKNLFIARDRSGIKPLYYYKKNNEFWFSSEVRPISQNFSLKTSVNGSVMLLLLGCIPGNTTIYSEVKKFPSGHYGWLKNGVLNLVQYYSHMFTPKLKKTKTEVIEDVKSLVESCIKRNLISDAPIGTFLSGGLDSSIITAVAANQIPNLKTVSVSFSEERFTEQYFQNLVSKRYNTEHHEFHVTKDIFQENLISFFKFCDHPNIDGYNTFLASKMAKQAGLKAILAGQGADEIFFGYDTFHNAKKYREKYLNLKIINFFKTSKEFFNKGKFPQEFHLYNKIKDLILYLPSRQLFSIQAISKILRLDTEKVLEIIISEFSFIDTHNIPNYDDKVSLFELKLYLESQLLAKDDVYSMANSLEVRIPFLDNELLNYVTRIDPIMKYNKKMPKYILAKAFEDYLPDELLKRDKSGFSIPYSKWMTPFVDKIDKNSVFKELFKNNEIGWTKYMSTLLLKRFNNSLELSI